ncbi:hypothetical protein CYLTODRAFT_418206 [Cylindrobasidium torrendii FP15055 ss-10]|uniref:Brain protein I3 n=1 Tax=Cylindrobasidium torrendii FP15055 ss-10 TaxID=1314674 RepID=A0A0D7BN87_9AGAR|nr:hypothetical protein CYLTODRAFT_418206 [Cylindrobasidium torrendii FP15055 ss-10]
MMINDNVLAPPPMYSQQPEAGHSSAPPSPTGFKAPYPEQDVRQSTTMPMPSPAQSSGSYMQPPPAAQPYGQAQDIPLERKTTVQQGEEYRSALYAKCARGEHQLRTHYGVCGIVTSVLLFPIGLFALMCDNTKKCTVCGVIVS